jgi:hypothetical protein
MRVAANRLHPAVGRKLTAKDHFGGFIRVHDRKRGKYPHRSRQIEPHAFFLEGCGG